MAILFVNWQFASWRWSLFASWQILSLMTNRIKQIRKTKNLTLEQLSEETGISVSHLSRIEGNKPGINSRGLSLENALRISRALGTDVIEFTDEFNEDDIAKASTLDLSTALATNRGDIQNLTINAGMGPGRLEAIEGSESGFVPADYVDGFWSFPERIRDRFGHINQTHALPVVGDSMEPTLRDGGIVFVDTTHVVPSPPDLYAVDYGDGLMVKRIELIPRTNKVRVISDNTDRYATYELDRNDLNVFGRVVASFQWRG